MTDNAEQKIIATFATDLAAALGDGWSVSATRDWYRSAVIEHTDGRGLWITLDWRNQTKVSIAGLYPLDAAGKQVNLYGDEAPEINVTITRPIEAIAKDVNRRLMGDYEARLARVRAYVTTDTAKRDARAALVAQVIDAYVPKGAAYEGPEGAISLPGAGRTVTVNYDGTEIGLELRRMRPDIALRLLAVLAEAESTVVVR